MLISRPTFPEKPEKGAIFFLSEKVGSSDVGNYMFNGKKWVDLGIENIIQETPIESKPITLIASDIINALGYAPTNPAVLNNYALKSQIVQPAATGKVYDGSINVISGTAVIQLDSSAPTIADGAPLWSCQVSPTSVNSKFAIDFSAVSNSTAFLATRTVIITLFRNNTIIAWSASTQSANSPVPISLKVLDVPKSTTPVTYSLRVGISGSGTFYIGRASGASMGDANNSGWTIREVL